MWNEREMNDKRVMLKSAIFASMNFLNLITTLLKLIFEQFRMYVSRHEEMQLMMLFI